MPLADGDARALFENAPVALLLADGNGNALALNPRFYRLAGLYSDEAAGAGWINRKKRKKPKRTTEKTSIITQNKTKNK